MEETSEGYGDGREFFEREGFNHLVYDIHCSFDYAMPMVFIKGSRVSAYRGGPKFVSAHLGGSMEDVIEDGLDEMYRFVEMLGIESKPVGWYLTSIYG